MTIIFLSKAIYLEGYLHVTVTLAYTDRVVPPCCAVQIYCPACSAVTLEMTRVADPVLFCRFVLCKFLLDGTLVHLTRDGGKLSTLQVRLRASPSFTVVFPVITDFFTSLRQKNWTNYLNLSDNAISNIQNICDLV